MLPVAAEIDVNRTRMLYGATAAAVASLFDKKAGKEFRDVLDRIQGETRKSSLRARGQRRDEDGHAEAARTFMDFVRKHSPQSAAGQKIRTGKDVAAAAKATLISGSHGR